MGFAGWRGAGGWLVVGLLLGATQCSSSGRAQAGAVASAEHCGGQALTPTLHTRLSRYSAGIPSTDVYVLQLCHPQRGCHAVASYRRGMAPVAYLEADGLRFSIPMAQDLEVFEQRTWIGEREIPLTVEAWTVRTEVEIARANQAHGLDPRARVNRLHCRRDTAPRPYYAI